MKKKKYAKIFTLALTAVALAGAVVSCSGGDKKKTKPIPPVEVGKVIQKSAPLFIDAVGNVFAFNTVEIRPQVSGILVEANFRVGQDVSVGQLIYTIDPAPYIAELQRAESQLREDEAGLRLANDKVKRYTPLAEQDYISALQYDELLTDVALYEAKVGVDKADIERAKINVDYCYVRSPINGKISLNNYDPGNFVSTATSQSLTSIRQMDPILVEFNISQRDFLTLQYQHGKSQAEFDFLMLDTTGKEVTKKGRVYFVDNNFDTNTGTILLRGEINNSDYSLWPGEFGKVRIVVRILEDAILVPEAAVNTGQKGQYVYVLEDDGTVQPKPVTIIQRSGEYFIIKDELKAGDTVVTNGQVNLQPGMKVQVRTEEKQPEEQQNDASPENSNKAGMTA